MRVFFKNLFLFILEKGLGEGETGIERERGRKEGREREKGKKREAGKLGIKPNQTCTLLVHRKTLNQLSHTSEVWVSYNVPKYGELLSEIV